MGFHNPAVSWSELEGTLSGNREYVVDPLAVDGDGGDSPAWSRKRQPYQAPPLIRREKTTRYAELHCHTNFSFLDGASHPEELAEEAAPFDGRAVLDTESVPRPAAVLGLDGSARPDLVLPTGLSPLDGEPAARPSVDAEH